MKQKHNLIIFLFVLLLFLVRGSVENWMLQQIHPATSTIEYDIAYQNLLEEYQNLANAFEIENNWAEKITYSKLLYRDPFGFWDEITILKGEEEQLTPGLAVMSQNNLIGIITNTHKHQSTVKLLTNPDTVLSVKVKESYGIMTTNSQKECWIENLTKEVNVEIGEVIKTSGLTDIPGNIPIGTVEQIQVDSLGLIQKVKVKLNADLDNIDYVVILEKEGIK